MMLEILFKFILMIAPDFEKQVEISEYIHATLLFVT